MTRLWLADEYENCKESLSALCGLLDDLGFVVHEEKSVLEPTQDLLFLGFQLDSKSMSVRLTGEKREKFRRAARQVLERDWLSIREVAGLIGLMVAYSPAVEYGEAHTKLLEREKNEALVETRGNFDGKMKVSDRAEQDILWWLNHLEGTRKVRLDSPEVEIYTDASLEG